MSTIFFHKIVFGPIKSRRLGNSLGINLLPDNGKLCSFDCIYCECGWNKDGRKDQTIPSKEGRIRRSRQKKPYSSGCRNVSPSCIPRAHP